MDIEGHSSTYMDLQIPTIQYRIVRWKWVKLYCTSIDSSPKDSPSAHRQTICTKRNSKMKWTLWNNSAPLKGWYEFFSSSLGTSTMILFMKLKIRIRIRTLKAAQDRGGQYNPGRYGSKTLFLIFKWTVSCIICRQGGSRWRGGSSRQTGCSSWWLPVPSLEHRCKLCIVYFCNKEFSERYLSHSGEFNF